MAACPKFKLSNGMEIPAVGLGTWKSKPGEVYDAVKEAINVGYRHIDCAFAYQNEKEVGNAIRDKIKDGTVKREDLWITTKCWNTFHSTHLVLECCQKSLSDLGLDYVDLYLVHWPFGYKEGGEIFPRDAEGQMIHSDVDFLDTWKGMEQCYDKGWVKSVGLSNFNSEQIERILKAATVKPVMNQVECHPYLNQKKLNKFCNDRGVLLTAYSPLGSPDRPWDTTGEPLLLEDPKLKEIADKYGKSIAQILIRWQVDRGIVVIPKSVTPKRIKENFDVFQFKLNEEDMKKLESFNRNHRFLGLEGMKSNPYYPFHIEF